MRCFIGVPLNQEYQERLRSLRDAWQKRLQSRMTWTRPGNWHVTLRFLGEISKGSVPELVQALGQVTHPVFDLEGGGSGSFPKGRRPRVLWVGLKQGGPECSVLASGVANALLPLGFEPEPRPFSPHLTLARIRQLRPDPWGRVLEDLAVQEWPVQAVDRFVLWQSELGPAGPRYTVVREFPLLARQSGSS